MATLLHPYEDVFLSDKMKFDKKTGSYEQIKKMDYLLGNSIVATDGTFLGIISNNRFDSNSIINKWISSIRVYPHKASQVQSN